MTAPTDPSLTVGDFRNLMDLRTCQTRDTLREAWLALHPAERSAIRWDPRLAAHARTVLGSASFAQTAGQ